MHDAMTDHAMTTTVKLIITSLLLTTFAYGQNAIVGHPKHGPSFTTPINPQDSIGSLLACRKRVHQRGGGTCEIPAGALRSGKHDQLQDNYKDVKNTVRFAHQPNRHTE